MSTNGNHGWKPRKLETITLSSGQKVTVRRPGPELGLRAQRVARTFTADRAREIQKLPDESDAEYNQRVIAEMSDDELAAVTILARELVLAMCVSPKLVLNPDPLKDEIGPDDIGNDLWELFEYAMRNFYNLTVPVGETEVEVKDLESFREESGVSGVRVDSVHVPAETEHLSGDQGLVDSAGA